MFSNSKNLNISGGEFNLTYGAAKSFETAERGKHIFVQFLCHQISSQLIYRYQAPPKEDRTWCFTQFR